jgi:uncharacterized protein (UPF0335 family)
MKADPSKVRALIERLDRTQAEKDDAAQAQTDVYADAKSQGFDVPAFRKYMARRKMDTNARDEQDAWIELFESAGV